MNRESSSYQGIKLAPQASAARGAVAAENGTENDEMQDSAAASDGARGGEARTEARHG